ncbi:SRPBCC family protein [Kitasatospora sp. NBC_00315]|uniref:SRPBCC family protein n=1 Tax=Kitasatospora sp. NBC_00315 TaxID=2975963 RepID=UPI003255FBC8
MKQVEESIEVDVPVSVAYAQWTRFEEFPMFMDGVQRIDRRAAGLTHWVVRVAGATREFDARVTEQIPDERVAWTTVAGDLHQAGVVTFHRLDSTRTKVMLQLDHDPHGLVETVGDLLGFADRQAIDDLRAFKAFIESRGATVPAPRAAEADGGIGGGTDVA